MPYSTGESEEFSVKMANKELAGVKDDNKDIWVSKVMEFCLPRFDGKGGFDNSPGHVLDLWE